MKKPFTTETIKASNTIIFPCGVVAKHLIIEEGKMSYWVTNEGRVFNEEGKEMKQMIQPNGYLTVKIGGFKITVHKLIALLFLPAVEGKYTVDHIDRNKQNNHLSNLRWADEVEQARNRRKPKTGTQPVILRGRASTIYLPSIQEASEFLDRAHSTVSRAIRDGKEINGYVVERAA